MLRLRLPLEKVRAMSDVTTIGAQAIYCGKKWLSLCVNDEEYGT